MSEDNKNIDDLEKTKKAALGYLKYGEDYAWIYRQLLERSGAEVKCQILPNASVAMESFLKYVAMMTLPYYQWGESTHSGKPIINGHSIKKLNLAIKTAYPEFPLSYADAKMFQDIYFDCRYPDVNKEAFDRIPKSKAFATDLYHTVMRMDNFCKRFVKQKQAEAEKSLEDERDDR